MRPCGRQTSTPGYPGQFTKSDWPEHLTQFNIMSTIPTCPNRKIKVLIADDSRIIREHLVLMLDEVSGIEIVGQAETVAEAIREIGRLQPDAVILDIRMPDGNGIDVLRAIKQHKPSPLFIILTNFSYPAYRRKCFQAGADYFLDKSAEFDQIPELIRQYEQKVADAHI